MSDLSNALVNAFGHASLDATGTFDREATRAGLAAAFRELSADLNISGKTNLPVLDIRRLADEIEAGA